MNKKLDEITEGKLKPKIIKTAGASFVCRDDLSKALDKKQQELAIRYMLEIGGWVV